MHKKLILISAILWLNACEPVYWRYCATDAQTKKDTAECHARALKAIPPGTGDYSGIHDAEKTCMMLRGYGEGLIKPPFGEERCGDRGN